MPVLFGSFPPGRHAPPPTAPQHPCPRAAPGCHLLLSSLFSPLFSSLVSRLSSLSRGGSESSAAVPLRGSFSALVDHLLSRLLLTISFLSSLISLATCYRHWTVIGRRCHVQSKEGVSVYGDFNRQGSESDLQVRSCRKSSNLPACAAVVAHGPTILCAS